MANNIVAITVVWAGLAIGLALLIVSVWAVLTSSKFRSKGRWLFVTCLGIPGVSVQVPPATTVAVVIPVGIFVVLWVWKFGASTPQGRREHEARRPRSARDFFSSKDGYIVSALAAWALLALSMVSGPLAIPILAVSAGVICVANHHRGLLLTRRRTALLGSASWCLSVICLGVLLTARQLTGAHFNALAIGAVVALWPWVFCTGALIQNSYGLPQPDPQTRE